MIGKTGRVTPDNITKLEKHEIFVFGSNESGIHGAGAALTAKEKFGAEQGKGWGPTGQCFGLPTKGWNGMGVLPIIAIECYVGRFSEYVMMNPDKQFLVTQIGCGLAGYTPKEIAPLFAGFGDIKNVSLPQSFWDIIDGIYEDELAKSMEIENDGAKNELSNL